MSSTKKMNENSNADSRIKNHNKTIILKISYEIKQIQKQKHIRK